MNNEIREVRIDEQYFEINEVQAIEMSLKHWKELIVNENEFDCRWFYINCMAEKCALCQYHDFQCDTCPMEIHGESCVSDDHPWNKAFNDAMFCDQESFISHKNEIIYHLESLLKEGIA